MDEFIEFLAYTLSAMGLTILLVWPQTGPSAWVRERVLKRGLPSRAQAVLDCYICCGFWCGLVFSPLWWTLQHRPWCWTGCLVVPTLFWLVLRPTDESYTRVWMFPNQSRPRPPPGRKSVAFVAN